MDINLLQQHVAPQLDVYIHENTQEIILLVRRIDANTAILTFEDGYQYQTLVQNRKVIIYVALQKASADVIGVEFLGSVIGTEDHPIVVDIDLFVLNKMR